MAATYVEALKFLEENFDRAVEKNIAYNNRFEVYCVSKGIFPTKQELNSNEEYAYDWFMALYYNQPKLLQDPAITADFAADVLQAVINHGDEDLIYMLADILARKTVGAKK
jgi:hypothetical protein